MARTLKKKPSVKMIDFDRLIQLNAQAKEIAAQIAELRKKLTTTLSTMDEKVVRGEFTFELVKGRSSYTYSDKVTEMSALLKARQELEKKNGTAKVTLGKPSMRITGGKK